METDDIPTQPISDWIPISNPLELALLGKLGEEACELGAALFRCVIQGIDEAQPVSGKVNRAWVEEEIADVMALTTLVIQRLNLDTSSIIQRRRKKIGYKEPWFDFLTELVENNKGGGK